MIRSSGTELALTQGLTYDQRAHHILRGEATRIPGASPQECPCVQDLLTVAPNHSLIAPKNPHAAFRKIPNTVVPDKPCSLVACCAIMQLNRLLYKS